MNMETWKIQPTGLSGLHLGRHGIEQEHSSVVFSSDSLFSALTSSVALLEGSAGVDAWMASLPDDDPAFVLSSAFPYAGKVRFYPVPRTMHQPEIGGAAEGGLRPKDLKKIRFVSEGAFSALLAGSHRLAELAALKDSHYGEFVWLPAETALLPADIASRKRNIVVREERPRVLVDRVSQASTLFFTGFVQFAPDCGLWFGLRWRKTDAGLRAQFDDAVRLLESNGLGGERNAGYGQVAISAWDTVEMQEPEGRPWVNLSRYLPRADEISALKTGAASYQLEEVGGWLQTPGSKAERRRSVNMISEGAVLGALPKDWAGQIVDVQPDYKGTRPIGHPIYRSGIALGVGLMNGGKK